jgi:AraC-like DNA-binding protein
MTMTSTISQFVWPRPALAGCIAGMLVRDTRGCALDQAQRFNFYPASALPAVSWRFAGDTHVIDQPGQMERPWTGARVPSFAFAGARLGPNITWNPGEVYAVVVAFSPDALSAMTRLDLSSFSGRVVPAEEALPQPMLEIFCNFFDSVRDEGPERSFSVLQDKVEIMWTDMRPAATSPPRSTADYITGVVHRAMATGFGRSARQIARRVKSRTGVSERDLQGFAHIEQLSLKWVEAARKGDVDWAGLAAESGFADQAHMIRRLKQHTGFTPKELVDRVRYDEAFWIFRLNGRIIDQLLTRPMGPSVHSVPHLRGMAQRCSWHAGE